MAVVPLIGNVYAGGMGGKSSSYSMGKSHSGMNTNNYSYYQDYNRLGTTWGTSPSYYNTNPYYNTTYRTNPYYNTTSRYNSAITPYTGSTLWNTNSLYPVNSGWNPYGATQEVVTDKDYTVEQSYTQFTPGGAVTTSVSETTDTTVIPTTSPWSLGYSNAYPYNNYSTRTLNPSSYGYNNYNSLGSLGAASPYYANNLGYLY